MTLVPTATTEYVGVCRDPGATTPLDPPGEIKVPNLEPPWGDDEVEHRRSAQNR